MMDGWLHRLMVVWIIVWVGKIWVVKFGGCINVWLVDGWLGWWLSGWLDG